MMAKLGIKGEGEERPAFVGDLLIGSLAPAYLRVSQGGAIQARQPVPKRPISAGAKVPVPRWAQRAALDEPIGSCRPSGNLVISLQVISQMTALSRQSPSLSRGGI